MFNMMRQGEAPVRVRMLSKEPLVQLQKNIPQSQRVFDNIYEQLQLLTSSDLTKRHRGARLLRHAEEESRKYIESIESPYLTGREIFEAMLVDIRRHVATYTQDPRYDFVEKSALNISTALRAYINKVGSSGRVDSLTARVFLRALPSIKEIGDYQAMILNSEDISLEDLDVKQDAYSQTANAIWKKQNPRQKWLQGSEFHGFFHFDSQLSTSENPVQSRIYICAQLSQDPAKVIEAWCSAVQETGLRHRVYFKIPTSLSERYETVIFYVQKNTDEKDIEKLLNAFVRKCPSALLNEKDMPTSMPLRRGISLAVEPANINKLLDALGERHVSYNQLMGFVTQISFDLAYYEVHKAGMINPKPKDLKEPARRYFQQMVLLCGLNPDSMMPDKDGGALPAWAERIQKMKM